MDLEVIRPASEAPSDERLQRLLNSVKPEDATGLREFSRKLESISHQVSMLCTAVAHGAEPIVSIDLCELIDGSFPITESLSSHGYDRLARRRVFTDIVFSRLSLEVLENGSLPFTVLPGTATEIMLFLREAYSKNKVLMRSLESSENGGVWPEWVPQEIIRPRIQDRLEKVLEKGGCGLALVDRFVGLVTKLVSKPNFIACSGIIRKVPLRGEVFSDLADGLELLRGGGRAQMNNVVDAFNLAVVSSLGSSKRRERVVHVTRTSALHRLSRQREEELRIDWNVSLQEQSFTLPVLCSPQALFIFSRIKEELAQADRFMVSSAERFHRYVSNMASYIREYAEFVRDGSVLERESVLNEMRAIRESSAIMNPFEEYASTYLANFYCGDQVVLDELPRAGTDRSDQADELIASREAAEAFARQEKLLELLGIMRHAGGFESILVKSEDQGGMSAIRDLSAVTSASLTAFEREGYRLKVKPLGKKAEGWEIQVGVGEEGQGWPATVLGVVLGLQRLPSDRSEVWFNLYWPTAGGLRRFVSSVSKLLGSVEECLVISMGDTGRLGVQEMRTEILASPSGFLRYLPERPVKAVQFISNGTILTTELILEEKRRAVSSIRSTQLEPERMAGFYEDACGLVPTEHVEDLVARVSK